MSNNHPCLAVNINVIIHGCFPKFSFLPVCPVQAHSLFLFSSNKDCHGYAAKKIFHSS